MAFRVVPSMSPFSMKELPQGFRVRTRSENQTIALGRILGHVLKEGSFVGIKGELGSGKTRLVKGIAEGLGVPTWERVTSPTFAIIHEYHGGRLPLYHVDLYRVEADEALDPELGLMEYLEGPGVCVVEWPEKIGPLLPEDRMELEINLKGRRTRDISLWAWGPRHESILGMVKQRLK